MLARGTSRAGVHCGFSDGVVYRAVGVGRAGAAGSPIIAGFLFATLGNEQLLLVSAIMAIGAVIGAGLLWMLPMRNPDYDGADEAPLPETDAQPGPVRNAA